jgi:alkaline phosphatase
VNDDKPVLGLFNSGNMSLEWSGPAAALGKGNTPAACAENQRPANEPSLAEMTVSAIKLLENRKGFFLQVEGASIDKQDHATNACGQLGETVAFDKAIGVALDYQRSHPTPWSSSPPTTRTPARSCRRTRPDPACRPGTRPTC